MPDIRIGKFDIFAVYTCQREKLAGMPEEEAKQYGFAIAVLGANAKRGVKRGGDGKGEAGKAAEAAAAAEAKKKKPITAEDYDNLLRRVFRRNPKLAREFERDMAKLVSLGLSYDDVKAIAAIPPTWGAKITWEEWKERIESFLEGEDV